MKQQTTAQKPKLYIGIDIHKKSWKLHLRTDLTSGHFLSIPSDAEQLHKYVTKHYGGYEVETCYEAGCCGYSAHRAFESFGWNSMVVNPGDIPKPL